MEQKQQRSSQQKRNAQADTGFSEHCQAREKMEAFSRAISEIQAHVRKSPAVTIISKNE